MEFSKEVSVSTALLCVCFILLLDKQYFVSENEECKNFVKRIIKKVGEEKFSDLDYEEKNELLTYFENIFELVDYEKFGIKYFVDRNSANESGIKIYCIVNDLKRYKENQSVIEMLAEMEPYADELYSIVSHLRMNTAMEKTVLEFEKYVIDIFNNDTKIFIDGLHDGIKSRTAKLFSIEEDEIYADDVSKEVIAFFEEYVNKEFELFKHKLISECKTYDFNPWILIGIK